MAEPGDADRVVIRRNELFTPEVDAALAQQMSFGMGTDAGRVAVKPSGLLYKAWFSLMLAGGLGALLGWAVLEPFYDDVITVRGTIAGVSGVDADAGPVLAHLTVANLDVYVAQSAWIATAAEPDTAVPPDRLAEGTPVEVAGEIIVGARDAVVATRVLILDAAPAVTATYDLRSLGLRHLLVGVLVFPVIAGCIGLSIGAADGILSQAWHRAVASGATGLGVGLVVSLPCTLLAELVYALARSLVGTVDSPEGTSLSTAAFVVQMVGRGTAWAFAGAAMGLGQGVALRSKKLLLNGLIGGVVGGLIGGLLFDPIDLLLLGGDSAQRGSAALSRCVGFGVIGLTAGLMIGLVELLAREAWVKMLTGPIAGKEFILYRNPFSVGSSPKSDLFLFKDPEVDVLHALVHQVGEGYEIEDKGGTAGTWINGHRVRRQRLANDDQIRIGKTVMAFQVKEG